MTRTLNRTIGGLLGAPGLGWMAWEVVRRYEDGSKTV